MADTSIKKVKRSRISLWVEKFKAADKDDKKRLITDLLFNNAMYIIIAIAVIFIAIKVPAFLSVSSIVNIVSLTAAKLPIALGIAGCIVLTGTDISAGRCVGLTACVAASLLQMTGYANKMFPNLNTMPLWIVFLAVIAIGAVVGLVNGFFVAKFKLHPFIVTLSTQLIVFGTVLMYLMIGGNNGQTLSGLDSSYTSFITGTLFNVGGVAIPKYVLYSAILTAIMFSMVGYFNGNNQTLWVMFQGLFQTLLVRLPMSYYMSIQPAASLTKIGLAAPASTLVGILLNVIFFLYFNKKINNRQ